MADHFIRLYDDGELAAEDGWAFAMHDDDIAFMAEKSAVLNEDVLNEAWGAVVPLVIEQAVRKGIVEWADPERRGDDPSGGGRVAP